MRLFTGYNVRTPGGSLMDFPRHSVRFRLALRVVGLSLAALTSTTSDSKAQLPFPDGPCPLPDSLVLEDTLDPSGYFPLAIGNRWEYAYDNAAFSQPPWGYEVREVIGDSLFNGRSYFVLEEHGVRIEWAQEYPFHLQYLVRYSEEDSTFVRPDLSDDAEPGAEITWYEVPENLAELKDEAGRGLSSFCAPDVLEIGGERIVVAASRVYNSLPDYTVAAYAHGIGLVAFGGDGGPMATLAYARVGGHQFGRPVDAPLRPREFFPLEAGNEWVFYEPVTRSQDTLRVVGDTLLSNQQKYWIVQSQFTVFPSGLVRIDSTRWEVLRATPANDGSITEQTWFQLGGDDLIESLPIGCLLKAPSALLSEVVDVIRCRDSKHLFLEEGVTFARGIGPVRAYYIDWDALLFEFRELKEARVGGRSIPVSLETRSLPEYSAARVEAYPNPFNDAVRIQMSAAANEPLQVAVFDLLGREIARIFDGIPSHHMLVLSWTPGVGVSSGTYLIRALTRVTYRTALVTFVR